MVKEKEYYLSVSASVPDWKREKKSKFWNPGKSLINAKRNYERLIKLGVIGLLPSIYYKLKFNVLKLLFNSEICLSTKIGGGLIMHHPYGIIIAKDVSIGPNCVIGHQVTIGTGSKEGVPKIGGAVFIGPGAKIIGGVNIGNYVQIGANAVVIDDVPSNCTAVGVPVRIIMHK